MMKGSLNTLVNGLNSEDIFKYTSECFNENKKLVIKNAFIHIHREIIFRDLHKKLLRKKCFYHIFGEKHMTNSK